MPSANKLQAHGKPGACGVCGAKLPENRLEFGHCRGCMALRHDKRPIIRNRKKVAKEQADIGQAFEKWRARRAKELDPAPEIPLSAFSPLVACATWHARQEGLSRLRKAADVLASKDGEDAAAAVAKGLDLIDAIYVRGGFMSEIQATYDLIFHLLEASFQKPARNTTEAEKNRRGLHLLKIREARTEARKPRNAELVEAWEKIRARRDCPSRTEACARVADEYLKGRESWRTVQRAVEAAGKW